MAAFVPSPENALGQQRQRMNKELDDALVRFRKLPLPVRVVYGRPRTFIALAVGILVFFLLPEGPRLPTRLVVAWDAFAALYLVLAFITMLRCDVGHIRRSAVMQDDGRFLLLLLTALGAFAFIFNVWRTIDGPSKVQSSENATAARKPPLKQAPGS